MITTGQLKHLSDSSDLAFGYVYHDGCYDEPFVFELTPENAASFIMSHSDADNIVITNLFDQTILNTIGYFIDRCPDKDFLDQIKPILIPMQLGKTSPSDFPCASMEEWENFSASADSGNFNNMIHS